MNSIMLLLVLSQIYLAKSEHVGQSDHPYVVRLDYNDTKLPRCTGTLIDKDWVLTAAHCLDPNTVGKKHPVVYAGEQQRNTKKVELYPHYDRETRKFDIGLIQVKSPFDTSSPNVSTVNVGNSAWPTGHEFNRSCVMLGYEFEQDSMVPKNLSSFNVSARHGDDACHCLNKNKKKARSNPEETPAEAPADPPAGDPADDPTDASGATDATSEATTAKPTKKPLAYTKDYLACREPVAEDLACSFGINGEALICDEKLVGVAYGHYKNDTCEFADPTQLCKDAQNHYEFVPAHVKWIKDNIGHHWTGGSGASTLTLAPIFLIAIAGQILNTVKNL